MGQKIAQYLRFLGNRMMLEIVMGRRLTRDEQRKLYNKSSMKLERELYGHNTKFETDDLLLYRSRKKGAFSKPSQ